VSQSNLRLELKLPPDEAMASYVLMLEELGCDTEVSSDNRRLIGREQPFRLCCKASPARVEIDLEPGATDRTSVEVSTSVPGFGPVTSMRLREWTLAIARRLKLQDDAQGLT
jgi:hypothetical protein